MLAAASAVVCLLLLLVPPCPAPKTRTKNWQRKPLSPSQIEDRDWWYSMGDGWDTSRHLARRNPFLTTFHRIQKQMDTYGWAKHVGKINRGRIADPGLNRGRHAFGYKSDFNLYELSQQSGNFKHMPESQLVKAELVGF